MTGELRHSARLIEFHPDRPRSWSCVDCGGDTFDEYYMVHDDVWAASGLPPDGGKLCVGCLEARLGRRLRPADFDDTPVNAMAGERSPRLLDRMGRAMNEEDPEGPGRNRHVTPPKPGNRTRKTR